MLVFMTFQFNIPREGESGKGNVKARKSMKIERETDRQTEL